MHSKIISWLKWKDQPYPAISFIIQYGFDLFVVEIDIMKDCETPNNARAFNLNDISHHHLDFLISWTCVQVHQYKILTAQLV